MRIWNAQVATPDRVLRGGGVDVDDGRTARVLESCDGGDLDLGGCYLLPGLLDLHVHPRPEDGLDAERLADLCREVRSTGTAGFLFALPNAPLTGILDFVRTLRANLDLLGPDAGCLGIHFEAPYVAHETRGGFAPEAIASPDGFPLEPLLEAAGPWGKYLNVSPELPGALDVIRECTRRGIPVSLGHTYAERDTLLAAVEAGAKTVCHTFDTGPIQRWKEPGVLDVTVNLLGMALCAS
jgi:N-acetylglucosamine-6-phosphate deacetylase